MLTDARLELRAYGAMSALIQSANAFSEAALKSQPLLKELPAPKQGQVVVLAMLTLLFDGQFFFWENVIADKQAAARFEKFFYTVFYKVSGVNPSRRLKDHRAHLDGQGEDGRNTYLGLRIAADVLGETESDIPDQLNLIYANVVKHYLGALHQIWEMPDAALAESKAELTGQNGTTP